MTDTQTFRMQRPIYHSFDGSGPYPTFMEADQFKMPQTAPRNRVRREARENAVKHEGSINLFKLDKRSQSPSPRCSGAIAKQNYEVGRAGHLGYLQNGVTSPVAAHTVPQTEGIPEAQKAGTMNNLETNHDEKASSPLPIATVKRETEELTGTNRLASSPDKPKHNPNNVPTMKPPNDSSPKRIPRRKKLEKSFFYHRDLCLNKVPTEGLDIERRIWIP